MCTHFTQIHTMINMNKNSKKYTILKRHTHLQIFIQDAQSLVRI